MGSKCNTEALYSLEGGSLITCCTNKLLNREIYCAHMPEILGLLHDVMIIT